MAKKALNVTIRKASSAQPSEKPATADAFVQGDRAGFRTLTLYVPEALAERLALHCRKTDRDMSVLVSEIVQRHLDGLEARVAPIEPEPESAVEALVKWVQARFPRIASLRPAWL